MTDPPADLARDDAPPPRRGRFSLPVVVAAVLAVVLVTVAVAVVAPTGGDGVVARDGTT